MLTPTHPTRTNARTAHCIECHHRIAPNAGRQVATGQYVCETCAGLRDSTDRYASSILSRVDGQIEKAGTLYTLSRIIHGAGALAPCVLQAIDDRLEDRRVSRLDIVDLAIDELRQMHLAVVVW
jgi:hypothetical protein